MAQQMGLALELLPALIASRKALSLHVDDTIVWDGDRLTEKAVYMGGRWMEDGPYALRE